MKFCVAVFWEENSIHCKFNDLLIPGTSVIVWESVDCRRWRHRYDHTEEVQGTAVPRRTEKNSVSCNVG